MKIIATIEDCPITLHDDGSISYFAKAAVDNDGSGGNPEGDPDHQSSTSLRHAGQSLNAQKVPFVVVPPAILEAVRAVILGARCDVTYRGVTIQGVIGDIGPRAKLGELSVEAARRLGMNPSPLHGGVDTPEVQYVLQPGIPAQIDGLTYALQPS